METGPSLRTEIWRGLIRPSWKVTALPCWSWGGWGLSWAALLLIFWLIWVNACLYLCLESGSTDNGVYLSTRYASCKQLLLPTALPSAPADHPWHPAGTAPSLGGRSNLCCLSSSKKHTVRHLCCMKQKDVLPTMHFLLSVQTLLWLASQHLPGCKQTGKSDLHHMSQSLFCSVHLLLKWHILKSNNSPTRLWRTQNCFWLWTFPIAGVLCSKQEQAFGRFFFFYTDFNFLLSPLIGELQMANSFVRSCASHRELSPGSVWWPSQHLIPETWMWHLRSEQIFLEDEAAIQVAINLFWGRLAMQWHCCPGSGGVTIPGGIEEPQRWGTEGHG